MRHVYVSDVGQYALVETQRPGIESPSDVIVKVTATTVCGSDVHLIEGHMGPGKDYALGHEFVGVVEERGADVQGLRVGDRVSAPAMIRNDTGPLPLGDSGLTGAVFGSGMGDLGGAMAEYVRVTYADQSLRRIPEGVTDAQALTVGDILATGMTGVAEAITGPGQTLVVFGAGPVGLSAAHTARLFGAAHVIVSDTIDDRLEVATALGATATVNPMRDDVVETVMRITRGRGAQAIVDAAGAQATISSWAPIAAYGARVGMVAIPGGPVQLGLADMQNKNMSMWTGLGDLSTMDALLRHIDDGILDPSPLFTESVSFDEIESAIADVIARKPGLIKPLVEVR